MELELSKEQIKINQILSKTRGEHIENIEIIVPDYLPDAQKIIKTDALIFLKEKSVSNDKITIGGEILFNALYLPENMTEIKSIKTKVPFKNIFTIKGVGSQTKLKADLNLGLVEGSIVNSRKVGLKAVVGIDLGVYNPGQIDVIKSISGPDNRDFETLMKPSNIFALTDIAGKDFSIEEDLYLPAGKKLIGDLLKNQINIYLVDKKLISNKAIIKGGILVKSLYTSQDDPGIIESVENEMPFSTIVDIEGIDEDHIADVSFALSDASIKAAKDSDGDMRLLNVAFNISSTVLAYKNVSVDGVCDAYSTQYDAELSKKEVSVNKLVLQKTLPVSVKEIISVTEQELEIKKVIDVSVSQPILDTVIESDQIKIGGNTEVSVICAGGAGSDQIFCIKKALPISALQPLDFGNTQVSVSTSLSKLSSSFNLNMSGELEVRISGDIDLRILENTKIDLLDSVVIKEKKESNKVAPLLFAYYPQKGDTVFNVSKKYGIKVSDLININKLDCKSYEDTLDIDMLLIPFKRK